ncbi:hypothetical protein KJ765_04945 [Candidatus Micrarchaeota archaeon]|nr:hypothetical protein [Candidatus Micrarchaeota archaeon]
MVSVASGFDLVGALTLVVSLLVLLYLLIYVFVVYSQKRRGKVRWDWRISLVFYLGIGIMALALFLREAQICFGGTCAGAWTDSLLLISLVIFIYAFKKRSDTAEKVEVEFHEFHNWRRRKGARRR